MSARSVFALVAISIASLLAPAPARAWRQVDPPRLARTMPQSWRLDETKCDAASGGPGVEVSESTLKSAIGSWNAVDSVWKGSYAGRTSTSAKGDRQNQVLFLRKWDDALGDKDAILAVAQSSYAGAGPVFGLTECDIFFNGDVYDWTTSEAKRRDGKAIGKAPMLSTMLHELGHCVGLGHSERNDVVMTAKVVPHFALQADDRAGALALYPPGTPLCTADSQCPTAPVQCQNGMCEVAPPGDWSCPCRIGHAETG